MMFDETVLDSLRAATASGRRDMLAEARPPPHNPAVRVTSFGPSPEYPRPLVGIALMIAAVSLFSVMDSGAKYLAERYPPLLVTWARFFFNVLVMLIALGPTMGCRLIRTRRPRLQLVRGVALGGSSVLFVSALAHMRLADATAVTFLVPMLVTLGAVFVFGQRAPSGTWIALTVSFLGVLLVIQPGGSTFTWWAVLPLGTAICAATYQLLTSRVAGIDSGTTSLFIAALVSMILLTVPALLVWEWPRSLTDAVLFVGIGTVGAFSHYLITRSFEYAPAATLAPYAYLQIIAAMLLGLAVFGNFPGPLAIAGIAMIITTGMVMALRQRFVARGRRTG